MIRIPNLLAASLLAAGAVAAAHGAASAATCPVRESYFGTIERANGNTLVVRGSNGNYGTVDIESGARRNTHGFALRPGAYIGAYGCVTPNGVFHASEITLARDSALYRETVYGIVRSVQNGRLLVREPAHHTDAFWYVPDAEDFHAGQRVRGTGMIAANGAFYPQTIDGSYVGADVRSEAPSNGYVTMSGRIQRIEPGRLIVWEPARRTSGTWIVRDTGAFRTGENVTATGTLHGALFYPSSIH